MPLQQSFPLHNLLSMAETGAEGLFWHHHVLDVAEKLEAPIPALTADTAAFDAAEWRCEVADAEAVDPDEAGAHALRNCRGMASFSIADATQAEVGAVRHRDGLFIGVEGLQSEHW